MDKEELKKNDLTPQMIAKFTQPKETWFIKRLGDNKILAMEEVEAWKTLTNKSEWVRHDFKIIGNSDGTTYAKIVKDSKIKSAKLLMEIEGIEVEANKYRKTEERFIFDDLLDVTDPKVIKVKDIIAKYDKALEEKNEEYFKITRDVVTTAFEAELAVAKANPKKRWPSNQDIITPGATGKKRRKVLRSMNEDDDDD